LRKGVNKTLRRAIIMLLKKKDWVKGIKKANTQKNWKEKCKNPKNLDPQKMLEDIFESNDSLSELKTKWENNKMFFSFKKKILMINLKIQGFIKTTKGHVEIEIIPVSGASEKNKNEALQLIREKFNPKQIA